MNKEKLDTLLANGNITEEEYQVLLSKLGEGEPQPTEAKEFDESKLDKLIQAKVDKITSKLGKEKADLQKELDKIKREKLSNEELKQLEITEKEQALIERERALKDKENRLYAIKAIKTAGLDDGGDNSLQLVNFVMAEEQTDIDVKVKAFGDLVKKFVTAEVNRKFKENGRTPNSNSNSGVSNNPFSKEHFNLTEQMRLLSENPELAKQLQTNINN